MSRSTSRRSASKEEEAPKTKQQRCRGADDQKMKEVECAMEQLRTTVIPIEVLCAQLPPRAGMQKAREELMSWRAKMDEWIANLAQQQGGNNPQDLDEESEDVWNQRAAERQKLINATSKRYAERKCQQIVDLTKESLKEDYAESSDDTLNKSAPPVRMRLPTAPRDGPHGAWLKAASPAYRGDYGVKTPTSEQNIGGEAKAAPVTRTRKYCMKAAGMRQDIASIVEKRLMKWR